jgi:hypothetical protein
MATYQVIVLHTYTHVLLPQSFVLSTLHAKHPLFLLKKTTCRIFLKKDTPTLCWRHMMPVYSRVVSGVGQGASLLAQEICVLQHASGPSRF